MGCDIHTIAQIKRNGKWETVKSNIGEEWRNYNSYAVLANVRNGSGFAGVKTGEGWIPISEPKGLPEDLELVGEDEVKTPEGTKWLGEHSHSYLTLAEIEEHMETKFPSAYKVHGVLTREQHLALIEEGQLPESWCGGKGGGGVQIIDEKDVVIDGAEGEDPKVNITQTVMKTGVEYTDVQASWTRDALESCGYLKKVIEELRTMKNLAAVPATDIRMVFGFDS